MKSLFISILLLLSTELFSQEYHFKYFINSRNDIYKTTKIVSIDKVHGDTVWAYANEEEMQNFKKSGYSFELVKNTGFEKVLNMATTVEQMATWDKYPTYEVYVQMMNKFATDYPSLCKIVKIGTTVNGRELLAVKISDNVDVDEAEPEFLYTSTIHGDEATGFVLMLRYIDYLLVNYGKPGFENITNLVNNLEIYINPDANPDGTYYGGNSSIAGARRYNANNLDLNRNFPDPREGQYPNGARQKETQLMMDFAASRHFSMSVNFHGGAEVVNYPWDTWSGSYPDNKKHPDDAWYKAISSEYISYAWKIDASRFKDVSSTGITNGGDWYVISGGRQDYMNYWHRCKEITIEISSTKLISSDLLPNYWNINKESFIHLMENCMYGISGKITDANGKSVQAQVIIFATDRDSSMVKSEASGGFYFRPLKSGTYDISYSAQGYQTQTHTINLNAKELINKDIVLQIGTFVLNIENPFVNIYPNPVSDFLNIESTQNNNIENLYIFNNLGQLIYSFSPKAKKTGVSVENLPTGLYLTKIQIGNTFYSEIFTKK